MTALSGPSSMDRLDRLGDRGHGSQHLVASPSASAFSSSLTHRPAHALPRSPVHGSGGRPRPTEARWHAGALFFEGAPAWLTATLSAALLPGTETPQGPQCRHARRCLLAPFGRALLLGVSPLPLTMPRTHGANCGTLTVTGTVTGTKKPCYGRRAA